MKDLHTRHAQLSEAGAPVELLPADQAGERTGSQAFHGALFDPRAGTIQPLAYAMGLVRAASQAGARIHTQSPVQTMTYEGGHWVLMTPGGTVRARSVIQATNAYHLALPDTAPAYVPVYYFQYATAPLTDNLRASILPRKEGCWDTGLIMTSFRLDQAGRMIIGGMGDLGHAGRVAHSGWVRRKLAELYPQLADQPLEHGWHGRIAITSDHIPKITQIGPNALAAHGYSGRGIGPGTVFGRMMATQSFERFGRLVSVNDAHRETYVDQRPFTDQFLQVGGRHTGDRHFTAHAGDIGHRHQAVWVSDLYDLSWDA